MCCLLIHFQIVESEIVFVYVDYVLCFSPQVVVPYHCVSSPKSNYAVLNSNHSYFLLVDNGTVGKYGGEILFRKKMEKFISHQKICISKWGHVLCFMTPKRKLKVQWIAKKYLLDFLFANV